MDLQSQCTQCVSCLRERHKRSFWIKTKWTRAILCQIASEEIGASVLREWTFRRHKSHDEDDDDDDDEDDDGDEEVNCTITSFAPMR